MRFNFPYRGKGLQAARPDAGAEGVDRGTRPGCVEEKSTSSAAVDGRPRGVHARGHGFECDGLLLLAYPLHPAGKPEKLRDAHLPQIRVPVLCFNGTRDGLCRRDLMENVLAKLSWRMHWLEGATHSFRANDLQEVAQVSRDWLSHLA